MTYENHPETSKRSKIGKAAALAGILFNVLLCIGKLIIGSLSGSMSMTADGLNNLSDAASSLVMLLSFKFAEKPADSKHPFGHARYEYLAGLIISMLILLVGFELAHGSIRKIFNPSPILFSLTTVLVLGASILLKLSMMICYRRLGKKLQSNALLAGASDSRNDALATSAVLLSAALEHFLHLKTDACTGLLVSLLILGSGIGLARKTISQLLGERADPHLQDALIKALTSEPMVLGCHDLMIHDYGPGRIYASIHVEMDERINPPLCHEIINRLEQECLKGFGVHLVIHYDPIPVDDPETKRLRKLVTTLLKLKDEQLEIHDFRISAGESSTELTFDLQLPESLQGQQQLISDSLTRALNRLEGKEYRCRITFDP